MPFIHKFMPIYEAIQTLDRIHFRFEGRWVHGHSGGVYPVPSRTRKSSPPASVPVLWCESPRECLSLCPSSFPRKNPRSRLGDESAVFRNERNAAFSNLYENKFRRNHEPMSLQRGEIKCQLQPATY